MGKLSRVWLGADHAWIAASGVDLPICSCSSLKDASHESFDSTSDNFQVSGSLAPNAFLRDSRCAKYPPTPLAAGGARQRRNYQQQVSVQKATSSSTGRCPEARSVPQCHGAMLFDCGEGALLEPWPLGISRLGGGQVFDLC